MMRKALLALVAAFLSFPAFAEDFIASPRDFVLGANGQQHGLGLLKAEGESYGTVFWSPKTRFGLPEELDYRTANQVAPVRDQGSCGSCWAFSLTKTHESARLRAGLPALNLSEQDQVSCDKEAYACNGGFMSNASWHLKHGLPLEEQYPYTATSSRCKNPEPAVASKVTKWAYCGQPGKQPTMAEIKQCLYDYGVLSVVVAAGGADWSRGGNMNGCSVRGQNHMVNLIGYGKKPNKAGALVEKLFGRNSWGTSWGEAGDFYATQGCDELASGSESVLFMYVEGQGPAPTIPKIKLPARVDVYPDTEIALGKKDPEPGVTYDWFANGQALDVHTPMVWVTPASSTVYRVKASTNAGTAESAVSVSVITDPSQDGGGTEDEPDDDDTTGDAR